MCFVIEIKHLKRNLEDAERDIKQALGYIRHQRKRWAILTNGLEWLFLDDAIDAQPVQKCVLTINLQLQADNAAIYLKQLLARDNWKREDFESTLSNLAHQIEANIRKQTHLNVIERKLRIQIGQGYARNSLGLKKTIKNELNPDERKFADQNFDELAERILGIPNPLTLAPHHEIPTQSQVNFSKHGINEVKNAIIKGIEISQKYTQDRDSTEVHAWLDDTYLDVTSWRDLHAGLAEAILILKDRTTLESFTLVYRSMTERRTKTGQTYLRTAYRQLSNGWFIYLQINAKAHQTKSQKMLEYLGITPQSLKILYEEETLYLP